MIAVHKLYRRTTQQLRVALQEIVSAKHHAVTVRELQRTLNKYGEDGKAAVQALIRANVLGYRPYSPWATDVPREAYGKTKRAIITAPTAVHLYCMKILKEAGDLEEPAQVEKQANT